MKTSSQAEQGGVLYVTHDGIGDHIGQSQVVPYLLKLAAAGFQLTLLSAEKPENRSLAERTGRALKRAGIFWASVTYHRTPRVVATYRDIRRMKREAMALARSRGIAVVHCRGYIASLVGLHVKRKLGTKLIFDMRGFWPDESRENGRLKVDSNPLHRLIYRFFKRKEVELLEQSDHIITLTAAARDDLRQWSAEGTFNLTSPITVVPCCADFDLFDRSRLEKGKEAEVRARLGLKDDDFVLIYLGSLSATEKGALYLFDQMLDCYTALHSRKPSAKFLVVANNNHETALAAAERRGLDASSMIVTKGERGEIPYLIAQADLGIFFINPSVTRRACSPTKLAELFAMDVPVIANKGVGDLGDILALDVNGSDLVGRFDASEYDRVVERVLRRMADSPVAIRAASSALSLDHGAGLYTGVYEALGARRSSATRIQT